MKSNIPQKQLSNSSNKNKSDCYRTLPLNFLIKLQFIQERSQKTLNFKSNKSAVI